MDLSSGLQSRVTRIYKVNPSRIPIQSSSFNWVSVWVDSKSTENADIAKTQAQAKRRADVDIKIAGAVWNNIMTSAQTDEADDDCESLMENIEEIIRSTPELNSSVLISYPTGVTYHSSNIDEEANLRAGILTLRAIIYY